MSDKIQLVLEYPGKDLPASHRNTLLSRLKQEARNYGAALEEK